MIRPLDELLADTYLSISHTSLRIFFHVSDYKSDNTQTKEYGSTYHDSFALQHPNQCVVDVILTMFALGLPVYDTWRHKFC